MQTNPGKVAMDRKIFKNINKHIINGRFQMNTTLRRGKFIIYEPLKGKVQRFKTLHWNSVFNMGPRLYNYMSKAFRDLNCDYLFF